MSRKDKQQKPEKRLEENQPNESLESPDEKGVSPSLNPDPSRMRIEDYVVHVESTSGEDAEEHSCACGENGCGADDEMLDDNEAESGAVYESAANFGNEDALNFLRKILTTGDSSLIRQSIEDIVGYPEDEYLDAQFCSEALAAAEMIAAAKGCPSREDFPPDAQNWLRQNQLNVSDEMLVCARTAVDRILHNSELKELWEEGCANDEWHLTIIDLRRRLG